MFRRIGWQVLLVGAGFLLTVAILAYLGSTYATEFRPAPGGTYVESVGGYPDTLNPLLSFYNDADSDIAALVFSGLTRMGPHNEVEPDLALGWEIDPTGITYTFRLNRDALWHDGMYVTADDVLFTVSLLQDPDYPGPRDIAELWRSVKAIKVDDYTVQFVLDQVYAPFLDYTTVGLLPAHALEGIGGADLPQLEFNRHPIGTGPFRVTDVEVTEGQITAVMLKRFQRYYGEVPYLENVVLRFYPTPRAAFEAYQAGEVEGVARIPVELLPEAFAEETLKLHSAPIAEMVMVYLNETITETVPFDRRRVRQALYFGLDRQALVDEVLLGQAILPESPLLPGTWAYTLEDVPRYDYEPARAEVLLGEEGWRRSPEGWMTDAQGRVLHFSLMAANNYDDVAMAQAVADQWVRLGVSVTVQVVPPLALGGALETRSYEAALVHLVIPGDPDPYPLWHESKVNVGQNYAGFKHRRISEIVEQARITVDREERSRLYHEFQQLFMEELPALPLYIPIYTYGVDERVQGEQMGPLTRTGDRFRTIAQWYVLQRRVIVSEQ